MPSGRVGRPGGAMMPDLGASPLCESAGWGAMVAGTRAVGDKWLIDGAEPVGRAGRGWTGSVFLITEMACVEAKAGALAL